MYKRGRLIHVARYKSAEILGHLHQADAVPQVNQLSVFWKQRDNLFFPGSCYVLPITILRIPYSAVNTLVWSVIVYWATGLTYSAGRQSPRTLSPLPLSSRSLPPPGSQS